MITLNSITKTFKRLYKMIKINDRMISWRAEMKKTSNVWKYKKLNSPKKNSKMKS